MTISYHWRIADLERKVEDGYVFTAHYVTNAKDEAYSSHSYGSVTFERPDNLIPYEDITEEIAVGWVKEELGTERVEEIEASLSADINNQKHPTTATGTPWTQAEVVAVEFEEEEVEEV